MTPAQPHASLSLVQPVDARNGLRSGRHRRPRPSPWRVGHRAVIALVAMVMAFVGAVAAGQPVAAAADYKLMFSETSDRAAPMVLEGATVEDTLYAFTSPDTDVVSVTFSLDGSPENTETNPPFDFNGGSVANGWGYDTNTLVNGSHTITAEITTGTGTTTIDATFTVDNPVIPDEFALLFSETPDRAAPMQLDGAVVDGQLYAFTSPDTEVDFVDFYLDDPTKSDAPDDTESGAPFDFGGATGGMANGVDTTLLDEGLHILTAELTLNDTTTTTVHAEFTVDNNDTLPMPDDFDVMVSGNANRSGAVLLEGETVDGDIFVFTTPNTDVIRVEFYVDDPTMSGTPARTDMAAPFDLVGGDLTALPFDTTALSDDQHNVTARIVTVEGATTIGADFTVDEAAQPLPPNVESDLVPLTPVRLADSRPGNPTADGDDQAFGRLAAGAVKQIQITGRGDVPANATAALLNVTAVRPDAEGYFTVYPCDETRPLTSNVNYFAGGIEPNAVLAKLSATGSVCIYTLAASDLVVDVNGYVPAGSSVSSLTPARLADSRPGNPTADGDDQAFGRLAAGAVKQIQITGRGDVPANATAALLNVTAVRPDAEGYFTVYPCDETRPLTSNVNYFAGGIEPNAVLAKLSATGSVCIYTLAASDLVVDVNGYTT